MNEPLRVSSSIEIAEDELHWRFSRSSGPGGQSVNTSSTRVELLFDVAASRCIPPYLKQRIIDSLSGQLVDGVVSVVASDHRSQLKNRIAARQRLAQLLRSAAAPPAPKRRATKPTWSSQRKRVNVKRQRGEVKRLRRNNRDD